MENRENSAVYKGCSKAINKALQKNLQSVSVKTNNVGYLKAVKANFIKCNRGHYPSKDSILNVFHFSFGCKLMSKNHL